MTEDTMPDETTTASENKTRTPVAPVPVMTRGQKYDAPVGRHSQQTHRLAEERTAASGNTTEKEQHAHDRSALLAETERIAAEKRRDQSKPK